EAHARLENARRDVHARTLQTIHTDVTRLATAGSPTRRPAWSPVPPEPRDRHFRAAVDGSPNAPAWCWAAGRSRRGPLPARRGRAPTQWNRPGSRAEVRPCVTRLPRPPGTDKHFLSLIGHARQNADACFGSRYDSRRMA